MNLGELSLEKKYRIFLNVTMSNEGLYEAQLRNFEEVPSIKKFEKFNLSLEWLRLGKAVVSATALPWAKS